MIITLGTTYRKDRTRLTNSSTNPKHSLNIIISGFGLGICQGMPPSPKGLCGNFRLLWKGCPKALHGIYGIGHFPCMNKKMEKNIIQNNINKKMFILLHKPYICGMLKIGISIFICYNTLLIVHFLAFFML